MSPEMTPDLMPDPIHDLIHDLAQPIRKLVIVGRDAAAWLAANALVRALGHALTVEVVELPSLLRPSDVYASQPALSSLHGMLGLRESDLLSAVRGVYSLGQSFANFSRSRPAFFHPYGVHGAMINGRAFAQVWLKARQGGMRVDFEDFSLNTAAAKQGRFFLPNSHTDNLGPCDFATHLKAVPYVQALKRVALSLGVSVRPARHIEARIDPVSGDVTAVVLSDGSEAVGDLFIDATGTASLLLGEARKVGFDSWQPWLRFDRTVTVSADALAVIPAYSQVRALEQGCLHLAPVRDATSLTFAFAGGLMTDDDALQTAAIVTGLRLRQDAVADDLHCGRRQAVWDGNVIALGEAAAVFDPIDNLGLHAVHQGLANLISLFPLDTTQVPERAEYNRRMASHFDRLRDFQIAHYKLNQNTDMEVWDALRTMPVPDELAYKIELFRTRGIIAQYDDETFETDNWLSIFFGHGLMPDSYDPLVDALPEDQLIQTFQRMLGVIKTEVAAMKPHAAYLEAGKTRTHA
ncbi:tryptophan halogenase family protein [Asticcacaulis biprosthecium C19]|uniref:Tryptophan halogenase family protein n=1 Tax=Asticcacaulis biprosthecium C19 TaxID=715226 RepID=F4QN15_9CAUL|nr:tryptophan 7-halogenase [Asticcacaulis biprosthecium]EGF91606.1 tryptophan halogenase family protein [Asticcacaulis biprosthecium C19]